MGKQSRSQREARRDAKALTEFKEMLDLSFDQMAEMIGVTRLTAFNNTKGYSCFEAPKWNLLAKICLAKTGPKMDRLAVSFMSRSAAQSGLTLRSQIIACLLDIQYPNGTIPDLDSLTELLKTAERLVKIGYPGKAQKTENPT